MKKMVLVGLAVMLSVGLGGIAFAWYGGYGGHHMMGPGYGGSGYGYMMGPGYGGYMMGPGYYGCGGNSGAYERTKPMTEKESESLMRDYIGPNPNLKVGTVKDKGNYFEGEIVTKENSLVTKLNVDKNTGWVQPLY